MGEQRALNYLRLAEADVRLLGIYINHGQRELRFQLTGLVKHSFVAVANVIAIGFVANTQVGFLMRLPLASI